MPRFVAEISAFRKEYLKFLTADSEEDAKRRLKERFGTSCEIISLKETEAP